MTTPQSALRDVILETLRATAPEPLPLDALYAAVEARIALDAEDASPPLLLGSPVSEPSWRRNVRNVLQQAKLAGDLVNHRRNEWRLPSPNPELALDEGIAWAQVRGAAEKMMAGAVEFASTQRGSRYRIAAVEAERIAIARLDANATETLSQGETERAIRALNAAGGRTGRRTLHYTVAKEVGLVFLHPRLAWDVTGEWIVAGAPAGADQSALPLYRDFGQAPDDHPDRLATFARRVRAGQPRFRENLLRLYSGRCAITGWGPREVLEAAHIALHAQTGVNHSDNGVLLRADLHTLFDEDLLRIHPDSHAVQLDERLRDTAYWELHDQPLRPRVDGTQPGRAYLQARWEQGQVRRNAGLPSGRGAP